MAAFYPGIDIQEIDEQQLAGYMQHVGAITKMQAGAITQVLAGLLKK